MIDIDGWGASGAGLLGAAAVCINVGKLLRGYLRQRTQMEMERERSARSLARTAGLLRLAERPGAMRVREHDVDGLRIIEVDSTVPGERKAA